MGLEGEGGEGSGIEGREWEGRGGGREGEGVVDGWGGVWNGVRWRRPDREVQSPSAGNVSRSSRQSKRVNSHEGNKNQNHIYFNTRSPTSEVNEVKSLMNTWDDEIIVS